jgi:hypothetical protein
MDHVQGAVDGREPAERERHPGPQTGAQAGEAGDRGDAEDDRDHGGERMAIGGHAGLAVRERVVEGVHEREDGGACEDERLPGDAPERGHASGTRAGQGGGRGHVMTVPGAQAHLATGPRRRRRGSSETQVRLSRA